MNRAPLALIGLLSLACLAASPCRGDELKDLYFGEALYYAHQGQFFEALERLDSEVSQHDGLDEPELGTLNFHIDDAEFSLGDFELRYRMHHRAGRAITAVLRRRRRRTGAQRRRIPARSYPFPERSDGGCHACAGSHRWQGAGRHS